MTDETTPQAQAPQEITVELQRMIVPVLIAASPCVKCGKTIRMPQQQGDALMSMLPISVAQRIERGEAVDTQCTCGAALRLSRVRVLLPNNRGPDKSRRITLAKR